jgi:omega-hydroxy-beta-dihydromenaquinone-9 sulfotransferase
MRELKSDLAHRMPRIYEQLGLPLSEGFRTGIGRQATEARAYRSAHDYSLDQFGLTREDIDRDLGAVYARLAARSPGTAVRPPSMAQEQVHEQEQEQEQATIP